MTTDLERYLRALAVADAAAAVSVLEAAASRGATPHQLIRDVLVPAQHAIGELWFEGDWSVADVHAATAVTEQALSLLAPPRARRSTTARIVVACAEGEWHSLPARLAGELTQAGDVDVVFLGGSIPAEHLQQYLASMSADALALSCTLATNLLGAARSIEAAHAEGVPVVVGGSAWGPGQQRAQRLGADRRMDDPAAIAGILGELTGPWERPQIPLEALVLDAPPRELLLLALERQCAASSWMVDMTAFQRDRWLEDLGLLARHAAAGVACDDPSVLGDLLVWLLDPVTRRGIAPQALRDGCHFLADAVEPEAPLAAALLRDQASVPTCARRA